MLIVVHRADAGEPEGTVTLQRIALWGKGKRAWPALALAAGLMATGLSACGGEETVGEPVNGELVVVMKDSHFQPKRLLVPVGETITVRAVNEGVLPHNLIVASRDGEGQNFRSDLRVDGGQESVFEMTFTKPGTYRFECGLHLPQMVGKLTVE